MPRLPKSARHSSSSSISSGPDRRRYDQDVDHAIDRYASVKEGVIDFQSEVLALVFRQMVYPDRFRKRDEDEEDSQHVELVRHVQLIGLRQRFDDHELTGHHADD